MSHIESCDKSLYEPHDESHDEHESHDESHASNPPVLVTFH